MCRPFLLFWTRKPAQPVRAICAMEGEGDGECEASRPSDGDLGLAKIVLALCSATPVRQASPGVGRAKTHPASCSGLAGFWCSLVHFSCLVVALAGLACASRSVPCPANHRLKIVISYPMPITSSCSLYVFRASVHISRLELLEPHEMCRGWCRTPLAIRQKDDKNLPLDGGGNFCSCCPHHCVSLT